MVLHSLLLLVKLIIILTLPARCRIFKKINNIWTQYSEITLAKSDSLTCCINKDGNRIAISNANNSNANDGLVHIYKLEMLLLHYGCKMEILDHTVPLILDLDILLLLIKMVLQLLLVVKVIIVLLKYFNI